MFALQRKILECVDITQSEVKFYHGIIYLYIVFLPLSRRVRADLVAKRGKKGHRSKGKINGNKRKANKKIQSEPKETQVSRRGTEGTGRE
jgi:hypothetical protein